MSKGLGCWKCPNRGSIAVGPPGRRWDCAPGAAGATTTRRPVPPDLCPWRGESKSCEKKGGKEGKWGRETESNTTNKISDNFGCLLATAPWEGGPEPLCGLYTHAHLKTTNPLLRALVFPFSPALSPRLELTRASEHSRTDTQTQTGQTSGHNRSRHTDAPVLRPGTKHARGTAQHCTHTRYTDTGEQVLGSSRCRPGKPSPHRAQPAPSTARTHRGDRGRASQPHQTPAPPAPRGEQGDAESRDGFNEPLRFCRGSEELRRPQGMDSGRQQSQPAPRFPLTVTLCPTHGQSQSSEWPDRGLSL